MLVLFLKNRNVKGGNKPANYTIFSTFWSSM